MPEDANKSTDQREPVVIKKYANRRLYNTESSTYVTLDDLAKMVRSDRDFVVYDAKTGDDLTHSVLTQIIVEQESRSDGQTLLPIPFLRQLIRFYDDSMGRMVPGYLQFSLEALTREQERYRRQFAGSWGSAGLEAYQEQARNNLKIFEQAMALWSPFKMPGETEQAANGAAGSDGTPTAPADPSDQAKNSNEINSLKAELEAMQQRIERLSQNNNGS